MRPLLVTLTLSLAACSYTRPPVNPNLVAADEPERCPADQMWVGDRCSAPVAGAVRATYAPPPSGGRWVLTLDRQRAECVLPCTRWLPPTASPTLARLPEAGRPALAIDLLAHQRPPLPPGGTVTVRPRLERGNRWLAVGPTVLGTLLALSSVALFTLDGHRDPACGAPPWGGRCGTAVGGMITGAVAALLGGAYWLCYYRSPGATFQVATGR
jgi:hypothetical protein